MLKYSFLNGPAFVILICLIVRREDLGGCGEGLVGMDWVSSLTRWNSGQALFHTGFMWGTSVEAAYSCRSMAVPRMLVCFCFLPFVNTFILFSCYLYLKLGTVYYILLCFLKYDRFNTFIDMQDLFFCISFRWTNNFLRLIQTVAYNYL